MDAYDPAQPLSRTRRQQLWVRLAIRGAIFVGLLLLVFVFGPPLLGYVMPFLLAFLFTWLMEPLLRFFQRRLRMPRKAGAIVLILILEASLPPSFCGCGGRSPPSSTTGTRCGTPFRAPINNWPRICSGG